MSLDQACLFTSITQLGFPIGGFLSAYMISAIGLKYTSLLGQAVSYILGYGLLVTASNIEMLLLARFLCGICQGFCNCVTVVYILELSPNKKVQKVSSVLLCLVGNAGTLVTYTIGIFVNWRQLAFISLLTSIPYVIGLVTLLPTDQGPKSEYTSKSGWKDVIQCKQWYLGVGITFFYQFAGYNIITNYAGSILQTDFEISGLDPGLINATFIGVAGLLGVIFGVILIHWDFERKYILLFSALGTSLAFLALGLYEVLQPDTYWVQTVFLVIHIMVFNLGYGCLAYPMIAELLPAKLRSKGLSLLMIISGLFGFLNNSSFDQLKKVMDTNEIYFMYSFINILGFSFLCLFLSKSIKIVPF